MGMKSRKRTKAMKRLDDRRADFDKGSQAKSADSQGGRWASGGYHRPGSNNK